MREADNDAMHRRRIARITLPPERAIRKIDMRVEHLPQRRNLLALRDGVGRDECGARLRPDHEIRRALEPTADVIEIAAAFDIGENAAHLGLLLLCA